MKPFRSNAGSLQIPRRRLRAAIKRHPARTAALGAATLLAGALAFVVLQSHMPQADEIIAAATDMTSSEAEMATSETAPAGETEATQPITDRLATAKPLPVAESPQQREASAPDLEAEESVPQLAVDEARWSGQVPAAASGTSQALAEMLASAGADRDVVSGNAFAPLLAENPASASDQTMTAAINPRADDGTAQVDVAESEADVAALEQAYATREAQGFALAAAEPGPDSEAPAASMATGTGIVDRHVNLRAEADNDATILAVVPQNGQVAILDDCPNWCAVEYDGHQGYIFGNFIERETTAAGNL